MDARGVDFSDRVSSKRKSYRTSSRRRRKDETEDEDGELSDDDEPFAKKVARLRRKVEEAKAESDRRMEDESNAKTAEDIQAMNDIDSIAQVSRMLDDMHSVQRDKSRSGREFGVVTNTDQTPLTGKDTSPTKHTKFTVEYAPNYEQSHALAKAADLDSRVALLEKYIGTSSSAVPGAEETNLPKPILPTLEILEQQLTTLFTSSPSELDAISRKVHQTLQEAERLEEIRKQSRSAQESARPGSGRGQSRPSSGQHDAADSDQGSKIHALYRTLPTIESLAPLLTPVLDRLHTLRAIHTNAARANESLDIVERQQQEMADDVKKWREVLEKVEKTTKGNESVTTGNKKVIEGWVKGLEDRMKRTG